MKKLQLEKIKLEIENKFTTISQQVEQMQVELVHLQGEHRLITRLIKDLTTEKNTSNS